MDKLNTANKNLIKKINTNAILNLIREEGKISRAEIAKKLKLNPATISSNVSDLLKLELIKEIGSGTSSGGRKPILLTLNTSNNYVIGVHMELTHINVGVLDLDGNMVYKTSEAYIFRNSKVDVNEIISTIIYAIKNILSNPKYPKENIIGVGIGVHGLVNSKEGISIFAPAFHWRDVPMQSIIEKELDMKVLIDNDVRVMALGEKWFGIARTCNDFVLFSLGEGIGGSLYINGNLYYGSNFGAGEIGHINVTSKPYQCDCGNKGCLTTVASEQGIIQRMKERIHEGEDTILNHQDLDTLTFDNICEAAVKGDTTALNLLEQTGNYIGRGLGIIVNLLNPEKIVLTGNVLKAKTFLIDHIRQKVSSKSLENNFNNTEITVSKLGDSLGIIGAGTLVLEDLFSVNH